MANTNEPDFSSLLQSLKLAWNTDKFGEELETMLSAINLEDYGMKLRAKATVTSNARVEKRI